MKPRRRIKDPLLGFGWAGYVCASVLLALLIALVAGVDLRYEFLKLIRATLGDDAMMLFVARLPFAVFGICSPAISIVTAVAILLALKIAPYRFSPLMQFAIFFLCTGWFLVVITYFGVADRIIYGLPQSGVFRASSMDALKIIGSAVAGLLVVFLTRSRLVAFMWSLAIAGALTEAVLIINSDQMWYPGNVVLFTVFDFGQYSLVSLMFDVCTMGSVILWALLERKKELPARECHSCGYNLAGLEIEAVCPECGQKLAATTIPPNVPPTQASV